MNDRDNLALLLLMFFVTLFLSCVCINVAPTSSTECYSLWRNCDGTADDYEICSSATTLQQEVKGDTRYYSYFNCDTGKRTPTLNMPADCDLEFR